MKLIDICELTKNISTAIYHTMNRHFVHVLHGVVLMCFLCFFDYEACPAGLSYADAGSACVRFQVTVQLDDSSVESTIAYSDEMTRRIDGGELYDIVKTNYPDTFIYGLGNPGKGQMIDPTFVPTFSPTVSPTLLPTLPPTVLPTLSPTLNNKQILDPTLSPTIVPTHMPTLSPTIYEFEPTLSPTLSPLSPTLSLEPTFSPTLSSTISPTISPTFSPTLSP